jgi:4-hydroxy-2-oxoglutarate aldolase
MKGKPTGLLVPITTPFDAATGDVAPVALRDNARTMITAGASGIVAAGSTGEASLLSEDEFRQVVRWLRDVVPDDRWLLAGAGRESTRATVVASRVAAEEGADGILVRVPSYYGPVITTASLIEHFQRVADESPIPLVLYNFPRYTHVPIPVDLVAALSKHENVWGAKDSAGDLKNFVAFREAAPEWSMLIGPGALYYAALELGATGAIAAVGNFAVRQTAAIGRLFEAGDRAAAGTLQEAVAPLHKVIVGELGIPAIKVAMDAVGLVGGPPRLPIPSLAERDVDRVLALLREAELVDS